jgi:uncharacterized protein YukE
MSYEVVVENLRGAATKVRRITSDLSGQASITTGTTGAAFGHVELAEWTEAVGRACQKAAKELSDGADSLASNLDASADEYERTDTIVAQGMARFTTPMGYDR